MSSSEVSNIQLLVIGILFSIATLQCQTRCDLKYELKNTRLINHYHESVNIKTIQDCEKFCLSDENCDAFNWKVSKTSKFVDIRCFLYKDGEFSFSPDDANKYTSKVCKVPSLVSIGKPLSYFDRHSTEQVANDGFYELDPNQRNGKCLRNIEFLTVNLILQYKIHSIHIWSTINTEETLDDVLVKVALRAGSMYEEFGHVTSDNEYRYDFGKKIYVVKSDNENGTSGTMVMLKIPDSVNSFGMCMLEVFGEFELLSTGVTLLNRTGSEVITTNTDGTVNAGKLAYDGNRNQLDVNQCFVSKRGKSGERPFWRIDLQKDYKVVMVRIYNQGKCCGHHFTSIIISVKELANTDWKTCVQFYGVGVTMRIYDFGCNKMENEALSASSVKVAFDPRKNEDELIICEIEIFVIL